MGFTKTRVTAIASQNTYSSYSTDDFGPEVGRENRTRMDMHGVTDTIGRGETDTDITYMTLVNENGDKVFTYPNAAGNGLITTQTRP